MTREEIIQKGKKKFPPVIIEEIRDDGTIAQTDLNATIRHAYIQGLIDNNCLLPSDLDEAANNYGIDIRLGYPRVMDETDKYIFNAFKAGAEWMAGQGVSEEFDVEDGMLPCFDSRLLGLNTIACAPTVLQCKDDDVVIMQLRKK